MVTTRFLLLAGGFLFVFAFFSCYSEDIRGDSVEYGGKKYKTIVINGQELMAENLNYNVPGSKCYDDNPANCDKYGRLYDWITVMELHLSCSSLSCAHLINTPHKGICPTGWHIPTNAEWDKLYRSIDGDNGTKSPYDSPTAGRYLKAKQGWNHCGPSRSSSSFSRSSSSRVSSSSRASSSSVGSSTSGSSSTSSSSSSFRLSSSSGLSSSSSYDDMPYLCDDQFGFTALPGGYNYPIGFSEVGEYGYWWSSDEDETDFSAAYKRFIYNRYENAYWGYGVKTYFFSVRCFKD